MTDLRQDLRHYLQQGRDGVLRGLEGIDEYDARRPMTPSATNLLGLVKHLTGIELSYLGDCVGRPPPVTLPWVENGSVWDGADMWARPEETRDELVGLYRTAWEHSDQSIATLPLEAPAAVSWWPPERRSTTFGHLLVRVAAETAQHAGHADIVRELIDGRGGPDAETVGGEREWRSYHATVQRAADAHRGRPTPVEPSPS